MRFCPNCNRSMVRATGSGAIVFSCPCGVEEPGEAADARISGAVLGATETVSMYESLIRTAPFDRTNQVVMRPCVACGLDYMVQIRVGVSEVIVYKCKCGREERAAAPAPAPTADA